MNNDSRKDDRHGFWGTSPPGRARWGRKRPPKSVTVSGSAKIQLQDPCHYEVYTRTPATGLQDQSSLGHTMCSAAWRDRDLVLPVPGHQEIGRLDVGIEIPAAGARPCPVPIDAPEPLARPVQRNAAFCLGLATTNSQIPSPFRSSMRTPLSPAITSDKANRLAEVHMMITLRGLGNLVLGSCCR